MAVLLNFSLESNFWDTNPQFRIPKLFAEFYKNDKSKGKAHSSKIMWAIALLVDNSEANTFRNLLIDDRKQLICEDYLDEPKFNWDTYKDYVNLYIEFNLSKLERSLTMYEEKLKERDDIIKTTKYNLDNAATLDKLIMASKQMSDFITKVRDDINREKTSGETKGSMEESASELGLL